MMTLTELVEAVGDRCPGLVSRFCGDGVADVVVERIIHHPDDYRGRGDLFVCMDEFLQYNRWLTWREFLQWLPEVELAAVVLPEEVPGLAHCCLISPDPRRLCGLLAACMAGNPDRRLSLFGVTGTNGKTTTTQLISHALTSMGVTCGVVGTLGAGLGSRQFPSGNYTTPLATELQGHMAAFVAAGAKAAAIEVSSHGLALDRVAGVRFGTAVLTNIGRDHLDFHGTQDAYVDAKTRLFRSVDSTGKTILNRQSPYYDAIAQQAGGELISFGWQGSGADLELQTIDPACGRGSIRMYWRGEAVELLPKLRGRFQMENLLAGSAALLANGYPLAEVAAAVADFPAVPGRMEEIALPDHRVAIVDYAHNPDGLRSLLENCRPLTHGRLLLVFGCGGDRDRGKRPLMGAIAAELADGCWVTSDNPRTEDPQRIVADILAGMPVAAGSPVVELDRELAIRAAYYAMQPSDLLVVAGKGHEDYQLIGHQRLPFSDQKILRSL